LSLDREEIQELVGHISEIEQLNCVLFKNESLHVSLDRTDESV